MTITETDFFDENYLERFRKSAEGVEVQVEGMVHMSTGSAITDVYYQQALYNYAKDGTVDDLLIGHMVTGPNSVLDRRVNEDGSITLIGPPATTEASRSDTNSHDELDGPKGF